MGVVCVDIADSTGYFLKIFQQCRAAADYFRGSLSVVVRPEPVSFQRSSAFSENIFFKTSSERMMEVIVDRQDFLSFDEVLFVKKNGFEGCCGDMIEWK